MNSGENNSPNSSNEEASFTDHSPDEILKESTLDLDPRLYVRHEPEDLTHDQYMTMNLSDTSRQLLDTFRSVAHHKGQFELCQEIYQPHEIWWPKIWDIPIYVILFFINGLLVYRGVEQILSELPFNIDSKVLGFFLGGALGLAIEIAIGKIIFVKLNLHWFFKNKVESLLKEKWTLGRVYPIRQHRIDAKISLCHELVPQILRAKLNWWDNILLFLCLIGLGIDSVGAIKVVEEFIRNFIEENPKAPVAIQSLQYIAAALPVILVLMIALILGNLIYYPRELNLVLSRFSNKFSQFDPHKLTYQTELNNELYSYSTCNRNARLIDIEIIKIQHKIIYLKECRNRFLIDGIKRIIRVNHSTGSQDMTFSSQGIDQDTAVDLLNQSTNYDARLKVDHLDEQIKILDDRLNYLINKQKNADQIDNDEPPSVEDTPQNGTE